MMSAARSRERETVDIRSHAMDDIRFIRSAMERAGSFTAVAGWGAVAVGLTAIATAALAAQQPTTTRWIAVWLLEAVVAVAIGIWTIARKAKRLDLPLASGPGRKFLLAFCPSILAGGVLTLALVQLDAAAAIPGMWLLLYGTGVIAAGAFSVPIVPLQGLTFLALGVFALLFPAAGNILLGAGFGGAHIVFGAWIARKYGG
jgi:hypothetical protein